MKNNVVWIKADGTVEAVKLNDTEQEYIQLQKLVGGLIQSVPVMHNGEYVNEINLWCNEEGKMHELPMNRIATDISGLYPHDVIVGDAVLQGGTDDEGNCACFADDMAEAIVKLLSISSAVASAAA